MGAPNEKVQTEGRHDENAVDPHEQRQAERGARESAEQDVLPVALPVREGEEAQEDRHQQRRAADAEHLEPGAGRRGRGVPG